MFSPEQGDARRLQITLTPLLSLDNVPLGVTVTFEDVTRYAAMQDELDHVFLLVGDVAAELQTPGAEVFYKDQVAAESAFIQYRA